MKTVILSHADCDGICSAAIAKSKFREAEIFFTKPVSFYHDLVSTDADRIVICDIALTKSHARDIIALLEEKSGRSEVLYFDHHQLPLGLQESDIRITRYIHRMNVSASELIYRHYMNDIPAERIWIALYGAIGDYEDDTPFAQERIANWDRRALFFEVSTLILGIKNREFDTYDAKRDIVKTMARGKNPSDVPGLVKSAKVAVTREFELYDFVKEHARKHGGVGIIANMPRFGFRGPAALFAATVTDSVVGMCIYDRRKHIDITTRKRNSDIALNRLMEAAAEHAGGSGGGHSEAAGARIPKGTLDGFMKKVNELLRETG
ncbi:MAG: DHH family phosphoesterase [Candidatus Aenigmarchaeota archaeon]|nr:DHH family phosphoesterase [Candidatus Aenigmarchaeota archaeon]